MHHIVVVGAGQAGASLVAKLRAEGCKSRITLIGNEQTPPYQRPPLSKKYLTGEISLEQLYLRPIEFYENNDIDLLTDKHVSSIDRENKAIIMDDGQLHYDQLVLTTGSVPHHLPASIGGKLDGVHVVRSLDHVDAMSEEFGEGRKALVVGGGYIGLEAAAVAASKGLDVTLVEMADRILQRVAAPETSDYFRELHTAQGVRILEGVGLSELTGTDRVEGANLTDGTKLDVDFVIVGVGIAPATKLAEAADLEIDNGIKVDEYGKTSDPDIWAAGDCTSFPYRGGRIRVESVPNAIHQAECVAENLMGAEHEYHAKLWFWSDQYAVKLQIAGLNSGYNRVITRAGKREGSISHWYYKDDTLLAVDAMNDPMAYMVGKKLIESGKSADPASIEDAGCDLKSLL
jgi:3-phenylpropionate/trans-cinnamate dioxygenase ferredoxin reductase subunit